MAKCPKCPGSGPRVSLARSDGRGVVRRTYLCRDCGYRWAVLTRFAPERPGMAPIRGLADFNDTYDSSGRLLLRSWDYSGPVERAEAWMAMLRRLPIDS